MELLNSTYRLGERRRPSFVFSSKPFGSIFAFNKTVAYKPNNSIIEITMYITTATELNKTAHKVSVALQGVDTSEYSKENLFSIIKMQSKFNKLTDEEILEKVYSEENIINGKFIIQSGNNKNKFLLVDKRIPLTTQVRVKCSCFSGDTKVLLENGDYKTLKELEGKNNFNIVAYNKNKNTFQIANAVKCELRRNNASTIQINLNDGTSIKTTPEHRFLKSNGEWVQARELEAGINLKSITSTDNLTRHTCKESFYTYIYLDPRKSGNFKYDDIEVSHEPFYVGTGTGIIRDIDNTDCYTRMSEIYEEGLNPILIKQDICIDKYVASQLKDKLVRSIGILSDKAGPLLNRKVVEEECLEDDSNNFTVSSIDLGTNEDVYCITTEGLGNFIIKTKEDSCGVVVENCSDYYYTFAYYNAENKVHIGMKPPKYTPYKSLTKKDGDFRPVRNPNRYPGVCKHILLFIALLMNGRILNPSNDLLDKFSGNSKRLEIFSRKDITLMLDKVKKELKEQNAKIKEQRQANKDYDLKKKGSK